MAKPLANVTFLAALIVATCNLNFSFAASTAQLKNFYASGGCNSSSLLFYLGISKGSPYCSESASTCSKNAVYSECDDDLSLGTYLAPKDSEDLDFLTFQLFTSSACSSDKLTQYMFAFPFNRCFKSSAKSKILYLGEDKKSAIESSCTSLDCTSCTNTTYTLDSVVSGINTTTVSIAGKDAEESENATCVAGNSTLIAMTGFNSNAMYVKMSAIVNSASPNKTADDSATVSPTETPHSAASHFGKLGSIALTLSAITAAVLFH